MSLADKKEKVVKELAKVINRNSLENHSNTPDHLLAEYLWNCLINFGDTSNNREGWYGQYLSIGNSIKQVEEEKK